MQIGLHSHSKIQPEEGPEEGTTLSERDCAGVIGVDFVEVFGCFFSAFLLSGAFLFVTALAFAAGLALASAFSAETETDFLFFFAGSLKELFTFTSLSLDTSFFSSRSRTFLKLAGRFFCLSSMNFAMAGWLEPVRSFSVTIASLIIYKIHWKIQIQPQEVKKSEQKKIKKKGTKSRFNRGLINQYLEVRRVCGGGVLLPSRLERDNLLFNVGHGGIH
ncbi:fimbrial type-4 assembly transmembrane protein [Striga asiatica]|uniref:Fimbrial type-4 assembly transmembrane protein n=1 Tax=Striga asiatica TaxID=4170 RepID=A0A5A7RCU7_STRAF|nr:fimbrial type-4 assembly transmembrane protein [Striga asiatica]